MERAARASAEGPEGASRAVRGQAVGLESWAHRVRAWEAGPGEMAGSDSWKASWKAWGEKHVKEFGQHWGVFDGSKSGVT